MFALGAIISAVGSIYTGITSLTASKRQAEDLEYQGLLAMRESLRDASIIREEGRLFAADQSLQDIGSGVHLVGSALITMAQTRSYAEAEAQATEQRGGAVKTLADTKAATTRAGGRAGLIGGIIGAGTALTANTSAGSITKTVGE